MNDKTVVLITGVADYWGARVATRLITEPALHVIGIDGQSPVEDIPGLDFIQADIRNPLLVELLQSENVDTVCHLKFVEGSERSEPVFDMNVMGAMKVLGACAEAGLRKVILRSSTAVYGAHADNSAFLTEESPLRGSRNYGYTRDLMEIEAFCNGFRSQQPQMLISVLRFANIVGSSADSPMIRFLNQKFPETLLGFDPIMQLIHEDDVVEALAYAVLNDVPGVFNVAAEGPMPLSRILRLVRKTPRPIFHPIAYRRSRFKRSGRIRSSLMPPFEWDYLRYPWVGDLIRMREKFGFNPVYMGPETLREFAGSHPEGEDEGPAEDQILDEARLRDIIERRRRIKEREIASD